MSITEEPYTFARTGLTLRNHLVMAPMASAKADAVGTITHDLLDHYTQRAQGQNLGLVITEHHFVAPEGKATNNQASIASDADISGLAREAAALHACDTPVLVQLGHAGSAASKDICHDAPIAPSACLTPGAKRGHALPRAMDADDIARTIDAYAQAARRAAAAGFDGVEIHAAHGYLIDQFISPLTNRRTDDYGGDTISRVHFLREVIAAVKQTLSGHMLISCRLGASDYMAGGTTIKDGVMAAKLLDKDGIDLISVSGGMNFYTRRDTLAAGYFSDASLPIKATVSAPVLLTGGIRKIEQGEKLLALGACDLVGVGRALLNNEHWADTSMRRIRRLEREGASRLEAAEVYDVPWQR
ncbi:MAG: NADH:flavin oxidoreductase [Atopobiaceae bacterium]|jgi:NADPH2 dehydrogenase